MSLAYYGLSFNPFDKQMVQEKDRFLSRDMTEMTQRLDYLKDARGIGVFTARPGMGKSFCLRCFAKSLNPNLYHMEYICLSTVSVMEFYRQFCAALGVSDKGGKPGMFKSIQEQIWYLYKEKRQPLLLAVDEAQYLSTGIYSPRPSIRTVANAMDVGDPSNFARILDLYGNSHDKIAASISGAAYDDSRILRTISECHAATGYVLDPHGACAYQALADGLRDGEAGVFLETAHPAKFKETVESAVGASIDMPQRLQEFASRQKQTVEMTSSFNDFKEYLMGE